MGKFCVKTFCAFFLLAFCGFHASAKKYSVVTLIGHASLKIKTSDGIVIYVDPYYKGNYSEKADFILVTHEHFDHNNPHLCRKNPDCRLITWKEALVSGEYKTFEEKGVKIEAVPSGGNANHSVRDNVGYIITVDGVAIYHAGDTSMSDGLKSIAGKKIDYAFYPIDGRYNMDAKEATSVADMIGALHNIPFHGDGMKFLEQTKDFNPRGKMVLKFGKSFKAK